MKKLRITLQISILCIVLAAASQVFSATRMPSFALPDVVTGEIVKSSIFEGKTLLITFFATWCPPCIEEIPTLKKLHQAYENRGFSVIGFSVDQGGVKAIQKLIKKWSINDPVILADSKTMQRFGGVYGIPESFLINKKGHVVKRYSGYIPQSTLEKDLKKPAPTLRAGFVKLIKFNLNLSEESLAA